MISIDSSDFVGQPFAMNPSYLDRITASPNQCGGRPCIRGMRVRVKDVLEMLGAGMSEQAILEEFPYLEREDIRAALRFAASMSGLTIGARDWTIAL